MSDYDVKADLPFLTLVPFRFADEFLTGPVATRLPQTGGIVGRDEASALALTDLPPFHISGQHCRIDFVDGAFVAVDLSRNGTFINSKTQRISKGRGTTLAHGDRLFVGAYEILVILASPSVLSAYQSAVDERGWGILQSQLGITCPPSTEEQQQILGAVAALWREVVESLGKLESARIALLSALGIEGQPDDTASDDAGNSVADTASPAAITAALFRFDGAGPGASADAENFMPRLRAHHRALAATARSGVSALCYRWGVASINRRCNRQFRFTGFGTAAQKSKCWALFEADFAVPEPVPSEMASAESIPAESIPADPNPAVPDPTGLDIDKTAEPPLPYFDAYEFVRSKTARAYQRALGCRAVSSDQVQSQRQTAPPLLSLALVRLGGKPVPFQRVMILSGTSGSIGRDEHATLQLDDPGQKLSRIHAVINYAGDRYSVIDSSRNGTFVNSRRDRLATGESRFLDDGDRLMMGDREFLVTLSGGPVAKVMAMVCASPREAAFARLFGLAEDRPLGLAFDELMELLAIRLRGLVTWFDEIEALRSRAARRFGGHGAVEAPVSSPGLAAGADARTFNSQRAGINHHTEAVIAYERCIVDALAKSVDWLRAELNPPRFLAAVGKNTVLQGDAFLGDVFLSFQHEKAWELFVAETTSKSEGHRPYGPRVAFKAGFERALSA